MYAADGNICFTYIQRYVQSEVFLSILITNCKDLTSRFFLIVNADFVNSKSACFIYNSFSNDDLFGHCSSWYRTCNFGSKYSPFIPKQPINPDGRVKSTESGKYKFCWVKCIGFPIFSNKQAYAIISDPKKLYFDVQRIINLKLHYVISCVCAIICWMTIDQTVGN